MIRLLAAYASKQGPTLHRVFNTPPQTMTFSQEGVVAGKTRGEWDLLLDEGSRILLPARGVFLQAIIRFSHSRDAIALIGNICWLRSKTNSSLSATMQAPPDASTPIVQKIGTFTTAGGDLQIDIR